MKHLKMIFCHHEFPKYWVATYTGINELTWEKRCPRCGKTIKFTMPLDNIQSAWEHYQKLRKEYRV